MKDNVVQFPRKAAVFTEPQRRIIEETVNESHPGSGAQVAASIENELSRHFIETAREMATRIGEKIGKAIAERLLK